MKYIVDFENSAQPADIETWLSDNCITEYTCALSIGLVYIVDSTTTPKASEIVTSITPDVNISSQLLGTVEVLPLSTGPEASFDNNADWWKTAVVREPDFNNETTTFTKRGSKSTVYVVDSGIVAHPDLQNADVQNLFTFTGEDFTDTVGHGTAIASIIAGETRGLTVARVAVVKILDSATATMMSDMVSAIDAIHADILSNTDRVPVVNMSWSIPKNDYIEQKLQTLVNAGATLVVAAGNSGVPIENVTPASMDAAITVGAFTEDFVPADFSNYTSDLPNTEGQTNYGALDGWAPGVNIGVASLNGGFGVSSGTSIAAAIASASLAYNGDSARSIESPVFNYAGYLKWHTFARRNLLELSGKYQASINVIVTAHTDVSADYKSGAVSFNREIFPNEDNAVLIAISPFVTKIELDGDLPDGLILSNGWVLGKPTTPPAADMETIKYVATVTLTDGTETKYIVILNLFSATATPADIQLYITLNTCSDMVNCIGRCSFNAGCGGHTKTSCYCSDGTPM